MKVEQQPAYVLHLRHFRDTSAIVDFFTPDFGKVSGIVKGLYGKNKKSQQQRALLQINTPLLIDFIDKPNLKTVTQVDVAAYKPWLQGEKLYCLMYVNEIFQRLLTGTERHTLLFAHYSRLLEILETEDELEPYLREIELALLEQNGYGIDLSKNCETQLPLEPHLYYDFQPQRGCVLAPAINDHVYLGAHLIAIQHHDFSDANVLVAAKRLMRFWLRFYLGKQPLASRQLYKDYTGTQKSDSTTGAETEVISHQTVVTNRDSINE